MNEASESAAAPPPAGAHDGAHDAAAVDAIVARASAARRRVLFLDYDGTLVAHAARPEDARPDAALLRLLADLAGRCETWVVSGRGRADLDEMLGGVRHLSLGAEHGAWARPFGQWQRLVEGGACALVRPSMAALAARYPGSRLEDKDTSVCWHYRQATTRPTVEALATIEAELQRTASAHGCEVIKAVLALDVRPRGVHKGRVVALTDEFSSEPTTASPLDGEGTFVLAAGDDVTDADLFASTPPHAVCVAVGERLQERVTLRLEGPTALRALLERIAAAL